MKLISKLINQYKDDSANYDDFDDNQITEVFNNLNESLNSLNENDVKSYSKHINNFKHSLDNDEHKEIMKDFITYCKHYNKTK